MKKFRFTFLATTVLLVLNLASCKKETLPHGFVEDAPSDSELAEYTVMICSSGGGNLDKYVLTMNECILDTLKQLGVLGKKINVTYLYKFSSPDDLEASLVPAIKEEGSNLGEIVPNYEEFAGNAYRGVLSDTLNHWLDNRELLGFSWYDMTSASALRNFIDYSVEKCPAKKYLLMFFDHGSGYNVCDDYNPDYGKETKGLCFDGNLSFDKAYFLKDGEQKTYHDDRHFTAKTIAQVVKQSGIRFEAIEIFACLENSIENVSEYVGVVDYVGASSHISSTSDRGAAVLCVNLLEHPDDIELAFRNYYEYRYATSVDYLESDEGGTGGMDLCLTNTTKLAPVLDIVKQFASFLYDTQTLYSEMEEGGDKNLLGAALQLTVESCYRFDYERPYFDLTDLLNIAYFVGVSGGAQDVVNKYTGKNYDLASLWSSYKEKLDEAVAIHKSNSNLWGMQTFADSPSPFSAWSVNLVTKGVWTEEGYDYDEETKTSTKTVELRYSADGSFEFISYTDGVESVRRTGTWFSTAEETYGTTVFDKSTGWMDWLLINEFETKRNPIGIRHPGWWSRN